MYDELVSVVILNWNGKAFIQGCIESVLGQDYKNMEIIVVDNASTDGSPDMIESEYKDVVLLRNKDNLGFGGGNDVGIKYAHGDYIVMLNNDTELDKSCISEMKKAIEKDEKYGSCASKIYLKFEEDTLDAAGIVVYPDGLSIGRGRLERGYLYNKEEEVFCASDCCCMYRRAMLEDIKLHTFDEYYDCDFFAYADETDIGWRAQIRGWRCIFTPKAKVYHMHSASAGTYSPFKAFLVERNRIWLQIKSFPLLLLIYGQFFTLARYFYQAYGAFFGKGASGEFSREHSKTELIEVLLKVYASAIKGMPRMLTKRREIQQKRLASTGDMLKLLNVYGIKTKDISLRG
ncbi:MAG: glycosyltransferase family 2 protein [Syntrophorhabdales bacterium]|nr:glycosyltransferase family 2 protein [Syntrophorhabdales bacterium]